MNQEKNVMPSRFKFGLHEKLGIPAIMYKDTGDVYESFAKYIPEGLVVQRLWEIREDEIMRDRLVAGTSMENSNGNDGGIITDFSSLPELKGELHTI